jgi:Lar family restriction alleviation protein
LKTFKSCPFCGSDSIDVYCIDDGWGNCHYVAEDETWSVECDKCSAEGPWGKTKEEAIELWNGRHLTDESQKV